MAYLLIQRKHHIANTDVHRIDSSHHCIVSCQQSYFLNHFPNQIERFGKFAGFRSFETSTVVKTAKKNAKTASDDSLIIKGYAVSIKKHRVDADPADMTDITPVGARALNYSSRLKSGTGRVLLPGQTAQESIYEKPIHQNAMLLDASGCPTFRSDS